MEDRLKLNSSADYSLDSVELSGVSGIGIFAEEDLIAIAQGSDLDLSAGYVDYV